MPVHWLLAHPAAAREGLRFMVIFLPLCRTTGRLDAVRWGTSVLPEWLGVREVVSGLGE